MISLYVRTNGRYCNMKVIGVSEHIHFIFGGYLLDNEFHYEFNGRYFTQPLIRCREILLEKRD